MRSRMPGYFGVEGAQLLRKIDVQGSLGGTDADGSVFQRSAGAQLFLRILDLHRRRCNAGIEQLSFRRQGNAAVGADEQHTIQLAFQPVHGVGDVGLIAAQHPRSLGKVLILCHIVEDLIIFPVHVHGAPSHFM